MTRKWTDGGDHYGTNAIAPHEIPARGWKQVGLRVVRQTMADQMMLIAAGVTYYMLLALVPALAVFISLYGLFNDLTTVNQQVSLLAGVIPAGGLDIIKGQLNRLASTSDGALSLTLIISLVVALWSASAGVKSLFQAMNIAYNEKEKRNFATLNLIALGFTLASVVGAIVFLGTVVIIPVVLQALYLDKGFEWLISVASYGLMVVLLLAGLSALYRWGPSREQAKWRWITPGAIFSLVAIGLVSVVFSWYTANFSNYNATYGSLGALVGLLTWIWLSNTLLLVGAELNSELEHQTARDSTTGFALPMGRRGAYMADHVARSGGDASVARQPKGVRTRQGGASAERWVAFGLMGLIILASSSRRRR